MTEQSAQREGSIAMGMIWMIVISLLLFWLPTIGPLLAGIVGGKRAGGVGAALVAALLPAIALSILLAAFTGALAGMPLIGLVAGMGTFVLLLFEIGPLLLGAIIGGLLAR